MESTKCFSLTNLYNMFIKLSLSNVQFRFLNSPDQSLTTKTKGYILQTIKKGKDSFLFNRTNFFKDGEHLIQNLLKFIFHKPNDIHFPTNGRGKYSKVQLLTINLNLLIYTVIKLRYINRSILSVISQTKKIHLEN